VKCPAGAGAGGTGLDARVRRVEPRLMADPSGHEGAERAAAVGLHSLYVGTRDVDGDLAALREALGAAPAWRFQRFGADVAAVRLPDATLVILADHRPPGSVLPLIEVPSLDAAPTPAGAAAHTVETPDGPCRIVTLPGGVSIGYIEVRRRGALDRVQAADPGER
jgi:hypothetical protein